jgi:2-hydroxy-3-keto-5-methylthiopentenyl-1-phosphate phosphatase
MRFLWTCSPQASERGMNYKGRMVESIMSQELSKEKILITVEETSYLLNMGMTKCRAFIKEHENEFVVKIGGRKYVNRELLVQWINRQCRK